jgi:hypothetical protein
MEQKLCKTDAVLFHAAKKRKKDAKRAHPSLSLTEQLIFNAENN